MWQTAQTLKYNSVKNEHEKKYIHASKYICAIHIADGLMRGLDGTTLKFCDYHYTGCTTSPSTDEKLSLISPLMSSKNALDSENKFTA